MKKTNSKNPVFKLSDKTTEIIFAERIPSFSEEQGIVLFVTDSNCACYLPKNAISIVLNPGEKNKTFASIEQILNKAFSLKMDRSSRFVGLGGGVITDMTAFAASLYMRGTQLSLIPTTLLSMVDASLGGKTGIDYKQYKNSVGSFYPAENIYIVPDVLKTLPMQEKKNGLTEVVKSAMLDKGDLWDKLNTNKSPILSEELSPLKEIIRQTLLIKGSIVERDFRETGERVFLNLGHTFGHALETLTNFGVAHGEGVAYGIIKALQYGELIGITETEYKDEVFQCLKRLDLIPKFKERLTLPSPANIYEAMSMDKKRRGGILFLITQKNHGNTVRIEAEYETIMKVLSDPLPQL